jgi:hypothetical protein
MAQVKSVISFITGPECISTVLLPALLDDSGLLLPPVSAPSAALPCKPSTLLALWAPALVAFQQQWPTFAIRLVNALVHRLCQEVAPGAAPAAGGGAGGGKGRTAGNKRAGRQSTVAFWLQRLLARDSVFHKAGGGSLGSRLPRRLETYYPLRWVVQQSVASPSAASLLVVEAVGKLPGALPQPFIQTACQLIGMAVSFKVAPLVSMKRQQGPGVGESRLSEEEIAARHSELIENTY